MVLFSRRKCISELSKYLDIYGEAKDHCGRLRKFGPCLYNEERLNEVPIPVIPNNDDVCQLVSSSSDTVLENSGISFDQNETGTKNSVDTTSEINDCFDEIISSTGLLNDSEVTTTKIFLEEGENVALEISSYPFEVDLLIKQEPEFHLDDDDQNIFDEILSASVDGNGENGNEPLTTEKECDDDERFLDADKIEKFPMPMVASQIGLTKREDDPISMSMAFNEKVTWFLRLLNEHLINLMSFSEKRRSNLQSRSCSESDSIQSIECYPRMGNISIQMQSILRRQNSASTSGCPAL